MQRSLTAYTSNMKPRDKTADAVIIIGPDRPGQNFHHLLYKKILEDTTRLQLKCVILGDGEHDVNVADIARLPEARQMIILAHGNYSLQDGAHTIHLASQKKNENSREFVSAIQATAKAKKILFLSCYGGRICQDINTANGLDPGTEIITCSAADAVSSADDNAEVLHDLLNMISCTPSHAASFTDFYRDCLRKFPETSTYGYQTQNRLQTFTVRREDRAASNKHDVHTWVRFNIDNFNIFLKKNCLHRVAAPRMTNHEISEYRKRALLHHIWHGDAEELELLIRKEPETIRDIRPEILLDHAFRCYEIPKHDNTLHQKQKKIASLLLDLAPQGLAQYFKKSYNPKDKSKNIYMTKMLLEIADERHTTVIVSCLLRKAHAGWMYAFASNRGLSNVCTELTAMNVVPEKLLNRAHHSSHKRIVKRHKKKTAKHDDNPPKIMFNDSDFKALAVKTGKLEKCLKTIETASVHDDADSLQSIEEHLKTAAHLAAGVEFLINTIRKNFQDNHPGMDNNKLNSLAHYQHQFEKFITDLAEDQRIFHHKQAASAPSQLTRMPAP